MTCHHRHVCTVQKHIPFSMCYRTPSPFWLSCRCFQLPPRPTLERHSGGLNQPTGCWARYSSAVHGLPRGQVRLAPWAAQGPVSVTMVSRVCSVTMVALVACTPLALVAIQPVTSVGVASAQCGGIGSPGAVCPAVPGVAVGVFLPRCTTPTMGSWVTPSICFWTPPPPPPLVSPRTCVRDV